MPSRSRRSSRSSTTTARPGILQTGRRPRADRATSARASSPRSTRRRIDARPRRRGLQLMVTRKSRREIEKMRDRRPDRGRGPGARRIRAQAGVSTGHLDRLAERHIRSAGAVPSFKGYGHRSNPFPASLCISIDDEVVHGIPGERTDPRRPDRVGRRRRDLRRLARRRRPDVRRRRARPEVDRARRHDAPGDDGRHRRGRAGRQPRRHLGRDRGRRRARRLRHRPPVRRPRHRHRDAPGAAGPELPDRRPRA